MIAWETDARSVADLERVLERVLPRHPHTSDITRAVELVHEGAPVLASDHALWQAARALAAVGDGAAASAVLSVTEAWAPWSRLVDLAGLPDFTVRLVESGLVQAQTSDILGGGTLVRLDLNRLPADAAGLELVYLPLARRLVDACAPLWAGRHGRGALVVRGLSRHAGRGRLADRWLTRAFQSALEDAAGRYGWAQSPILVQAG